MMTDVLADLAGVAAARGKPLLVMMTAFVLAGCAATMTAEAPVRSFAPTRREAVDIPPGHMPPPGECRVWFPGAPPGHQPPPGRCEDLERSVPAGAWLLYRPDERRRVYRIG